MSSRSGHHQVTTVIGVGIICMTIVSFIYFARSNNGQPNFETQLNHYELQSTNVALTKQYEALYEYKERLEKAYLSLKNEKATLMESHKNEKVEFTELKELYTKQVQTLQDDLKTCHEQLHSYVLSAKNNKAPAAAAGASAFSENNANVNAEARNNELFKVHEETGAVPLPRNILRLSHAHISGSAHSAERFRQNSEVDTGDDGDRHDENNLILPNARRKTVHDLSGNVHYGGKATSRKTVVDSNNIVSNVLKEPIQSPIAQVPMEPAQPSSDPNQDLVGNVLI